MIQKLRPDDNGYNRPNDPFVTQPIHTDGTDENDADLVAIKKQGLRWRRKVFTISVFSFVVGSLLILLNSPYRNEFLAPGPLCSSHAQILAGQGADRCAACHGAANAGFVDWVKDAFTGGKNVVADQSDLCMKCHSESLLTEFAKNPHSYDPKKLKQLASTNRKASFRLRAPGNGSGEIACSTCHREHHGDQSLTELTNQQCQSCHSQQFHSFETNHPEFVSWPNSQRQGIAFDHTTHGLKYFPEKSEQFNCGMCHVDDQNRNVKLLAPYQQTCMKCHDQQIHESVGDGLKLVGLPMLDLNAIEQNGLTVGQWPANSSGDFDGRLPPIMQLLLNADPQVKSALNALSSHDGEFSFIDVDSGNKSQLENVVTVAWGIKGLVFDLSQNGVEEIRRRAELVIDRELNEREFASLTKNLDNSVFETVARTWMPKLEIEIPLYRNGKIVPQTAFEFSADRILTYLKSQDPDELAPNPLQGLVSEKIDAEVNSPTPSIGGNSSGAGQSADSSWTQKEVIGNPETDDEYLAVNPLQSLSSGQQHPNPNRQQGVAPSLTAEVPSVAEGSPTTPEPSVTIAGNAPPAVPATSGVHHVSIRKAGWFRNDELMHVSYIPRGHADEYVKAWTDIVASAKDAEARPETRSLFEKLTSWTGGFGNCAKCHTVDAEEDGSFVANWQPKYRDPMTRQFTHFSHGPHLIQPHLQDCTACHEMQDSKRSVESFQNFDSTLATSNFSPIKKANCSSCHAAGKTDNGCTQCHNYHIGSQVIHKD